MNVIFLDYEGVLETIHYGSLEDVERRIKLLGEICKEYNCKVVIEASLKTSIDEETLESENEFINKLFELFKKYGIEVIGRTPSVELDNGRIPMWKEHEIRLYLFRHPEIEHFCIIDDDDQYPYDSDLNQLRDYLVRTIDKSKNPEEEGLLERHKEEIGRILQKDNPISHLVIKYKKR